MNAAPRLQRPCVRPPTDVVETKDRLVLVADLPGVAEDSVELELREDLLVLRAKPVLAAPEGWQPVGAEFELPDYERAFRLGVPVEPEGIEARLQNGRLRVVLKKAQPATKRVPVSG
jgi:HSP20 family molecular chaperone IbpA